MARIRTIKPEFFRHSDLYELERSSGLPVRVAFAGLWTACDREGRFKWKPAELKLDCLPFDPVDFSEVLTALEGAGFIARYVVDGCVYGHVPSFQDHQSINQREAQSRIPAPEDADTAHAAHESAGGDVGGADARTCMHVRARGEGKGKERKESAQARNTELPEDWHPGDVGLQYARSEGVQDPERELAKFRDHWRQKSGKDARKADWMAAWRNWCRRAADYQRPPPRSEQQGASFAFN